MSTIYDYWENQASGYNDHINTYVSLDDLSLTGKVLFNDKKIRLTGRMKISKDKECGDSLTGISDYSLNHTISPFTKYTISQVKDKTTVDGNWLLFKNSMHYLSLFTLMNVDTCEKRMNCGLKAHLRYHFNNHTMVSAGVEEYDHTKGKIPNLVSLYALHGHSLENGLKIYGGSYTGYLIKEKMLKYQRFLISLKNGTFNSLLNVALARQSPLKEDEPTEFDKSISLKIFNKVSNNVTVGGDIDFNLNTHALSNRLFTNYQLDKDTLVKSKWEDNDKSVTLTINHNFRGILRYGVTGKFNLLKNETNKCPIPKIKTKFGIFAEINETFI